MIIACPACSTRYVVPDNAIGVEGRTVRCAKCRHSWFQQGATTEVPETAPAALAAEPVAPPPPPPPPPPTPRPASQPVHEAPAARPVRYVDDSIGAEEGDVAPAEPVLPYERSAPAAAAATVARGGGTLADAPDGDAPSQFGREPPFRPRRNKAKLWTIGAMAFALVVAALIGAAMWFGLPDWVPLARPTFGKGRPDLELSFPRARQDRRTLPNGTEYFGASGTVTNVGKDVARVPAILIVMRDAGNRIVYRCDVAAPAKALSPGESATINQACLDVPRDAKVAEFGWKPD